MTNVLSSQGVTFRPFLYESEKLLEADVVALADHIFGASSLYLDIKKKMGNDIVTIPDGYVVDLTEPDQPRLFVVENEIVGHDPFRHVGIQLLKFVTSFDEAKRAIRMFLMSSIQRDEKQLKRLNDACKKSSSPNVDNYLDRAVYSDFKGLVVIDEARPELYRVLEKIRANISVLELKAFVADSGEKMFAFDTLYDDSEDAEEAELSLKSKSDSPENRAARRERRARSDTVVVPAREEGFQQTFLGENSWDAIRIGAAMKDRIKHIAAYRVSPISAITHIADVKEIRPYQDTGKYQLIFEAPAHEIKPVKLKDGSTPPQGPFYVQMQKLLSAATIDEALT